MPGFLVVAGPDASELVQGRKVFEPLVRSEAKEVTIHLAEPELFLGASSLSSYADDHDWSFMDSRYWAAIAGDVVGGSPRFWSDVIHATESGDYSFLAGLEGNFALVVYDRTNQVIHVVCDQRSQYPVYFGRRGNLVAVATNLGAFVRLGFDAFDSEWLWESLFFNFPLQTKTFLKGVERGYLAMVRTISLNGMPDKDVYFKEVPGRRSELLDSRKADDRILPIFAEAFHSYYSGFARCACALTGGWDGRTVMALAPSGADVSAYTWGQQSCNDMKAAGNYARKLGVQHHPIRFGPEFLDDLPAEMVRAVYESHGTQRVNRAGAQYAYRILGEELAFPLLLSGISFDMQFRGHAATPTMVSPELGKMFSGGEWDESRWEFLLGSKYSLFRPHIRRCLDRFQDEWGSLQDPEFHLRYLVYPVSLGHFSGDVVGAGLFSTLRVPSWDSRIVDLSFSISESTLTFSQFGAHQRGGLAEMKLQARLLAGLAPEFAKVPISTIHPGLLARDEKLALGYRVVHSMKNRLLRLFRSLEPLEDWDHWLMSRHRPFVEELLLGSDCRLREYLDPSTMAKVLEGNDSFTAAKLMTAEIILRQIENGWDVPENLVFSPRPAYDGRGDNERYPER